MGATFETLEHLLRNGYFVAALSHLVHVALLDLVVDPVLEWPSDDGGADIDEPPSWYLRKVDLIRQVSFDLWIAQGKVEDLRHGQGLVLRRVDGFGIIAVDKVLHAAVEVPEEVR